jgi:hypothetical protein
MVLDSSLLEGMVRAAAFVALRLDDNAVSVLKEAVINFSQTAGSDDLAHHT